MKKIFVALFMIIGSVGFAQESDFPQEITPEKKAFVNLSLGASIPVGDYASTDFENEKSGFATPGVSFSVGVGAITWGPVGLMAELSYATNGFDGEALKDGAQTAFPGYSNWVVETGEYSAFSALGGLYIDYPIGSSAFSVQGKLLAGFVYSNAPSLDLSADSLSGSKMTIKREAVGQGSFAFELGIGARYDLNDKFFVGINVDYFSATPQFRVTDHVTLENNGYVPQSSSSGIPLSQVRTNATFGYRF